MTYDETKNRIAETHEAYLKGKPFAGSLMAFVSIIASLLLNILIQLDELNERAKRQTRETERQRRMDKRR